MRAFCGVDPLDLSESGALAKMERDPVLLCDLVFAVVEPDAKAAGVDSESFGRSLAGDVITDAADAFLGALADFFPNPALGRTLRRVMEKAKARRSELLATAGE